jgi:hypothetical protein
MAGSVIYLGLSASKRRGPGEPRGQSMARRYLQISTGQLFAMTAWVALWIALEHQHVQRVGLITVVISYISSSIPFALLSLALVWAVNAKQSTAVGDFPLPVIGRFLMAIGIGIGCVVLGTCIDTARLYVWNLLNGHAYPPDWTLPLANALSFIGSGSTLIVLCGIMIVPWLVVVWLPFRQVPQGHDLTYPI